MSKLNIITGSLIEEICDGIRDRIASPDERLSVAENITRRFLESWAQTEIYIPSPAALERRWRNREIAAAFDNGASIDELCRKYQLSEQSIIKIISSDALGI